MRNLPGTAFVVVAAVAAVACSGPGGVPTRSPAGSGGEGGGSGSAAAASTAPTERECDALIAHAIALRTAELAAALPAAQLPTEAERTALHAELRGVFLAPCRDGTRRGYDCAAAATTLADLAACQVTRSSSTSNSSVAPGGILPPAAPRSP